MVFLNNKILLHKSHINSGFVYVLASISLNLISTVLDMSRSIIRFLRYVENLLKLFVSSDFK